MSTTSDTLKENDVIFKQGESPADDFLFKNGIDHGFWLNDLYFEVPPERIVCQEENNYADFQALRSTGSAKIPVGIATEIYVISFNITSKAAIINVDTRTNLNSPNNTGKRGGLFDLIVQFKHIPISVIENAYLRAKLKVPSSHNMVFCLHNLAISTSPGEPGTLVGQLTISPMAYTCYSDKWLYKRYWRSKTGFYFEDLNPIGLNNRVPYNLDLEEELNGPRSEDFLRPTQPNMLMSYAEAKTPFVLNPKVFEGATDTGQATQSIVNPMYQTVDSLNQLDLQYMDSFETTRYARESEPFKAYIDWIHYLYKDRTINNKLEDNKFDFTTMTDYGTTNINDYHGNVVKLKWNTFRKIAIDPDVADTIRLYIKRKIAMFRYELFETAASAVNFLDNPNEAVQSLEDKDSQSSADQSKKPKMTRAAVDLQSNIKTHLCTVIWMESGGKWDSGVNPNGISTSAFGGFQWLSSSWAGRFKDGAYTVHTVLPQGANQENVTQGLDDNKKRVYYLWKMNGGIVASLGMAGKWTMRDRADPEKATIASIALANGAIKEFRAAGLTTLEPTTSKNLQQTGKYSDLYLGHFMGAAGAVRFLKAYRETPTLPWTQAFQGEALEVVTGDAGSNLSVYYEGGDKNKRAKTMEEIYNNITAKYYHLASIVIQSLGELKNAQMSQQQAAAAAQAGPVESTLAAIGAAIP